MYIFTHSKLAVYTFNHSLLLFQTRDRLESMAPSTLDVQPHYSAVQHCQSSICLTTTRSCCSDFFLSTSNPYNELRRTSLLTDSRSVLHPVCNSYQMSSSCASGHWNFLKIAKHFSSRDSSPVSPRCFDLNEKCLYSFLDICTYKSTYFLLIFTQACNRESRRTSGSQTGFCSSLNIINKGFWFLCYFVESSDNCTFCLNIPAEMLLTIRSPNANSNQKIQVWKLNSIAKTKTTRMPMDIVLFAVMCKQEKKSIIHNTNT